MSNTSNIIRLRYNLAESVRKAVYIERGELLPQVQEVEIRRDELTPALRAYLSEQNYATRTVIPLSRFSFRTDWKGVHIVSDDFEIAALPIELNGIELLRAEMVRYDAACIDMLDVQKAWQAQKHAEEEARQLKKHAEEAERKQRETEKSAWIAEHGSAYLKEAFKHGYNVQRKYAAERAALEYPDFVLDFDGTADWKDRPCPSPEALAESIEIGGKVVWLIKLDQDCVLPCEAIVKRGFLNKYDLIKLP